MLLMGLAAGFSAGCGASLTENTPAALSPPIETGSVEPAANGASPAAPSVADRPVTEAKKSASAHRKPTATLVVAAPHANPSAYRIGTHDVLDISVFKVPELSKTVQVADNGTVNLPLVGAIKATGRTAREIEGELTKKYGDKYLQNPQITVYVKEFNSQRVTIDGAVRKPGMYPMRGQTTLLRAVALAEGLDTHTADDTVVVFRQKDGKRTAARFDIAAIRSGAAEDPTLQSGDVVVVGSSAIKQSFNNILKVLPSAGLFALL